MTDTKHYQLIFDNWRLYSTKAVMNEGPVYSYTGSQADPGDAWDPKTVRSWPNDDSGIPGIFSPGYPAAVTDDERASFGGTLLALSTVQSASENIGSLVKAAVGIIMSALKLAFSTAAIPFKVVAEIIKVLSKGLLTSPASILNALKRKGVLGAILKRAGFSTALAVPALGALAAAVYKAYGYISGTNEASPSLPEAEKEVASMLNWRKLGKTEEGLEALCVFCNKYNNLQHPQMKGGGYTGGSDGAKKRAAEKIEFDIIKTRGPFCNDILDRCPGNTEEYGFNHNLPGEKGRRANEFLKGLVSVGIRNKYALAGALAVFGKEAAYEVATEGAKYAVEELKAIGNGSSSIEKAVGKRLRRRFNDQSLSAPTDGHYTALSKLTLDGDVALLNIAYGYSKNQLDERIDLPILKAGKINPALYDKSLAGWKYRGRGPIQLTSKYNYVRAAAAAGISKEAISRTPELAIDPQYAFNLAAGHIKLGYKKIVIKHGKDPKTLEEGVKLMVWLVGAPGAATFPAFLQATLKRANQAAKGFSGIAESQGAL